LIFINITESKLICRNEREDKPTYTFVCCLIDLQCCGRCFKTDKIYFISNSRW